MAPDRNSSEAPRLQGRCDGRAVPHLGNGARPLFGAPFLRFLAALGQSYDDRRESVWWRREIAAFEATSELVQGHRPDPLLGRTRRKEAERFRLAHDGIGIAS